MSESHKEDFSDFLKRRDAHTIEQARLKELEKDYKSRENLKMPIIWENDINKIDLSNLPVPIIPEIADNLLKEYIILELPLEKVISLLTNPDNYSKEKLWGTLDWDWKYVALLELIEKKVPLIPPIIQLDDAYVIVRDGHHRMAISRFFKEEKISFLIKEKFSDQLIYYCNHWGRVNDPSKSV